MILEKEFDIFNKTVDGWLVLAYFSTSMNFLLGFVGAIILIFNETYSVIWLTRLVVLGASFDAIDGKLARKSKHKYKIGADMDTYADLMTFGIYPAIFIILSQPNPIIGVITAGLYVLTASFRLSRFVMQSKGKQFSGMPSPVSAIFIFTLNLIPGYSYFLIAISTITISLLMMSTLTFTSMSKIDNLFDKFHFVLGVVLMLLLTYSPDSWFPTLGLIFTLYIYYFMLFGTFHSAWQKQHYNFT